MADDCVFCRIVAGQIPALRVWEDAEMLVFLDIGPLAEGHVLVIPKTHFGRLDEMPPESMGRLGRQLPRLAKAIMTVTGAPAYNLLQNNGRAASQEVEHVHFHIIPRRDGDGLGYRWPSSKYPPGRGEELQRLLSAALKG